MTNRVEFYSFIDKCFPDFPNWIAEFKTKTTKYVQPKIPGVLLRRNKGQLCSGHNGEACKPSSGLGDLKLQTWLFK